jgi:hypothetical protein
VGASLSYCYSGEEQCSSRALVLTFVDDAVTGTGTSGRCWCATNSSSHETLTVQGTRAP